jgi:hypothetical protein
MSGHGTKRRSPRRAILVAVRESDTAARYSGGKAKFVHDSRDMANALRGGRAVYFVVPTDVFPKLPADLRQQLEIVAERNNSWLLRAKAGVTAPH